MKRTFNDIMNRLTETIADYEYYVDFNKIYKNIMKYENELNTLVGSKNIEHDFLIILDNYPKIISILPLLLAIRNYQVSIIDKKLIKYDFKTRKMSNEDYIRFMRKTKLFDLLENKKIKNISAYITGIEVRMDSNARKNRTGKTMKNVVEKFIKKTNYIEYHKEMNKKDIYNKYDINIDKLLIDKNKTEEAKKIWFCY